MENRLKERLTGAAILVALIVLIVPEMFHGPHVGRSTGASAAAAPAAAAGAPPAGAAPPGAAPEGPPVRSYTIDLTNSAVHAAPAEAGEAAPAAPASGAAPVSQAAQGRGAVRPAPAGPAVVPAPAPAARAVVAPPAPAAVAAPASPRAPAAAAAASPAGWSVQLGVFASGANAQRLMHRAQAMGFATHVSRIEPKGLYRVSIAGLADHAAAEQMSRKLHAAGLPAAILRPR